MLYCQAVLPRAGLGNRLFPWARCRVFAHLNNVRMIAPVWTQLKVGHFLRGEADSRVYHNLFRRRRGDAGRVLGASVRLGAARLPEPEDLKLADGAHAVSRGVYLFCGEEEQFRKLNGWDRFLREELRAITKRRWLKRAAETPDAPIAIHVRRGDFRDAVSEGEMFTSGGLRVPLAWFIDSLRSIRRYVGYPVRAVVFSDGTEAELRGLLALENVTRAATGSAIGDLLALSKARVLIASGGSSFSAWASFLGQMPTISHPGQCLTWFKLANTRGAYLGEFDPQAPSESFLGSAGGALCE